MTLAEPTERIYGLDRGLDLRDPCLSEEVQDRDRYAEVRVGTGPAAAQAIEK
jgi:hypothetical protein